MGFPPCIKARQTQKKNIFGFVSMKEGGHEMNSRRERLNLDRLLGGFKLHEV